MGACSNYLENKLLDHVLRNVAYTPAATVYIAVFTTTATGADLEAGTITNEVTGGSYTRLAGSFDAAASGATQNSGLLQWTNMPACTAGFVAVMDAASAGNVLFYGALTANRTLQAGDTFSIAVGDLDLALD